MELMNGGKTVALLIKLILADPAGDIHARGRWQKTRLNEKDINLNYRLTCGQHPVCTGVPEDRERPEMIKYHVSYLLSFHFLPPAHYRPDSLSGFYRADESGPPSGYHPLQLFIMTKQSHSLFLFLLFTASSILNHNPCLWCWRTSSH